MDEQALDREGVAASLPEPEDWTRLRRFVTSIRVTPSARIRITECDAISTLARAGSRSRRSLR
jgi:hypothetical protein